MWRHQPRFAVRLARSSVDVAAAQALRYRVFVEERGAAGGSLVDHAAGIEADRFDAASEHLLLVDARRGGVVAGACRILSEEGAARAGGFASEEEFDLAPLRRTRSRLLELGRSCLHPDYRGGTGMHALWQGLSAIARDRHVGLVFGLASFPGTDPGAHLPALSWLHHRFLAPADLRPRSLQVRQLAPLPLDQVDRRAATLATPPLVKAYLRLGGRVGEGVFADQRFGCTDVCLVLDVAATTPLRHGVREGAGA